MSEFIVKYAVDAHERAIASLKISNSTQLVASASADKTVKIFCIDNGDCVGRLGGGNSFIGDEHNYGINDCLWGRDDSYIVSCSDDKTLKLWDVQTERCVRTFTGHKGFVFSVQQHFSSGLLVSGSFDNTVRIWDARQAKMGGATAALSTGSLGRGRPRGSSRAGTKGSQVGGAGASIDAHADAVVAVDVDNSVGGRGVECVSGSLDGTVRTWDILSACCRSTLHCENITPVSSLSYAPNARFCLVSTLDGCHRLWDVAEAGMSGGCADRSAGTQASSAFNSNSSNVNNGIVQRYSGHTNKKFNVFSRIFVRGAGACASASASASALASTSTSTVGLASRKRPRIDGPCREEGSSAMDSGDAEEAEEEEAEAEAEAAHGSNHCSFICSGSEDGHVCVWDVNGTPSGNASVGGDVLPRETLALPGGANPGSAVIAVDCACAGGDIDADCLLVAGDLGGRLAVWTSSSGESESGGCGEPF